MFATAWVSDGSTSKYQTRHVSNTLTNSWNESLPLDAFLNMWYALYYATDVLPSARVPSARDVRPPLSLFPVRKAVRRLTMSWQSFTNHKRHQERWTSRSRHLGDVFLYVKRHQNRTKPSKESCIKIAGIHSFSRQERHQNVTKSEPHATNGMTSGRRYQPGHTHTRTVSYHHDKNNFHRFGDISL